MPIPINKNINMEYNTFCESATEIAVPTKGAVQGVANNVNMPVK